jgi:hypothetical protein
MTWKKLKHLLFQCPTFWTWAGAFNCTKCGTNFRCYWSGNDITNHGTDICDKCAAVIHAAKDAELQRDYEEAEADELTRTLLPEYVLYVPELEDL